MIKKIKIMGGETIISAHHKDKIFEKKIIEFTQKNLEELVNVFNLYDKKSNLFLLNKNRECDYNSHLEFLLKESFYFYEFSNRKFNVFLGKKILEVKSNKYDNFKIKNIDISKFNFSDLFEISKTKIRIIQKDILIDLGGIAKGYIIQKAFEKTLKKFFLKRFDLMINSRGDIICKFKKLKNIGIENPFNKKIFENVLVKKGSIITSGHDRQYFKKGSHIVGSESDILCITLKSEKIKTYILDMLGTYLIQLKSKDVIRLVEFDKFFKNVDCLIILKNGKIIRSFSW